MGRGQGGLGVSGHYMVSSPRIVSLRTFVAQPALDCCGTYLGGSLAVVADVVPRPALPAADALGERRALSALAAMVGEGAAPQAWSLRSGDHGMRIVTMISSGWRPGPRPSYTS